jgi:hypothetical protein
MNWESMPVLGDRGILRSGGWLWLSPVALQRPNPLLPNNLSTSKANT